MYNTDIQETKVLEKIARNLVTKNKIDIEKGK